MLVMLNSGQDAAALLHELLDSRVKDVDNVVSITNLPLLASFPKLDNESRRAPREAENFLRGNLGFALADMHPKVITVTSAIPTEGKTTVAVGAAMSFARHGYRAGQYGYGYGTYCEDDTRAPAPAAKMWSGRPVRATNRCHNSVARDAAWAAEVHQRRDSFGPEYRMH